MSTKKLLRISALMAVLFISSARMFASTIIVNSDITTNTTWTSGNTYIVTGYIYVKNGATLTINAGTLVEGDSVTKGSLIVTTDGKITAIGTACKPIVFTSEKPAGTRKRGDWGGLILLGTANVNWAGDTGHVEGINPVPETLYGGGASPNDGDNSGTLQYVRIEFAGIALAPNNEINGLTMGGVGNGTTIDHVQVSYSNDDSYEWFGGAVNCKYLVAYDGIDDDFDTDNGFSGHVQFGIGMRDPAVADVSGSKTFESDNDPTGSTNTPITSCVFNNMTCLGGSSDNSGQPLFKQSAHIRRNSKCKVYNSIMMGFPQGILVDGTLTIANCTASSFLVNDYVEQASGNYRGYAPAFDAACDAVLAANGNIYSTQYTGVMADPDFPASSPSDFVPTVGNPLPGSNTSVQNGLNSFFVNTSYVGAMNPDGSDHNFGDWTNWDPVNTVYGNKFDYTPTVTTNSITDKTCPNSGAVDISASGGISPYNYAWSNGATTQDLSGLSNGTFTITVFDAGHGCSAKAVKEKVGNNKPIFTSCNSTSTSITIFWAGNLSGLVTGYDYRKKKHSVSSWDSWVTVGNVLSTTATGLLSNTQYDFQLRGDCSSGHTSNAATITCATAARLSSDEAGNSGVSINAYPNPTNGNFQLSLSGFDQNTSVDIQITNALGQMIYTNNNVDAAQSLEIDLGGFANGIYHVQVLDGDQRYSQNVVLNK